MYKSLHLPLIATLSAALLCSACSDPLNAPKRVLLDCCSICCLLGSCDQYDENGTALFGDSACSHQLSPLMPPLSALARRHRMPTTMPVVARFLFFPVNAEGEATGRIKIDRPLDFSGGHRSWRVSRRARPVQHRGFAGLQH